MRILEFGHRTAHVSLDRTELRLVILALIELGQGEEDAHTFLDRTGTSPAHRSTLVGELQSLEYRMKQLKG